MRGLLWLAGAAGLMAAAVAPAAETAPAEIEARSLLGHDLRRPALSEEFRASQEELLTAARAAHEAAPEELEPLIWVGRRTAYLGRYREAVEIYTRAAERHPESAEPLRHRGHRMITLRRFDDAIADLERAATLREGLNDEVEPDGLPNARNVPTSTLHSNIWYHLGLARYLNGDFAAALAAYERCLEVSRNPDMLVATVHWQYMTLRRLGRQRQARRLLRRIRPGMDVIENADYYRLVLMYKAGAGGDTLLRESGEGGIGAATLAYGVGNWHLYSGRPGRARALFSEIVDGDSWAAFGYIAAEAELARDAGY